MTIYFTYQGKGELQTFWVRLADGAASEVSSDQHSDDGEAQTEDPVKKSRKKDGLEKECAWRGTWLEECLGKTILDERLNRLIDWNVEGRLYEGMGVMGALMFADQGSSSSFPS